MVPEPQAVVRGETARRWTGCRALPLSVSTIARSRPRSLLCTSLSPYVHGLHISTTTIIFILAKVNRIVCSCIIWTYCSNNGVVTECTYHVMEIPIVIVTSPCTPACLVMRTSYSLRLFEVPVFASANRGFGSCRPEPISRFPTSLGRRVHIPHTTTPSLTERPVRQTHRRVAVLVPVSAFTEFHPLALTVNICQPVFFLGLSIAFPTSFFTFDFTWDGQGFV